MNARTTLQNLAAAAAAIVGVVLLAPPAMAVTWGSQSNPLLAKSDGNAAAYGNFYNQQQARAASQSYRKDTAPGGNGVYVDQRYLFYKNWCDDVSKECQFGFKQVASEETNRWTSGSWTEATYTNPLDGTATKARGQIHVCEDQSFSGDPCSDWVLPTFNY